jgi:hypothetical protein
MSESSRDARVSSDFLNLSAVSTQAGRSSVHDS